MKSVCLFIVGILIIHSAQAQQVGPCKVFPLDNPWNTDISGYPVHPLSDTYISRIGFTKKLHPDFGSPAEYGIPYVVVGADQPFVIISYDQDGYPEESDPGPFPIPPNAPIEGAGNGGDQHVLVVDTGNCMLYELYLTTKDISGPGWTCYSSAKFDLNSNALRPDGWTSADAAGFPIFPGLVRYDEATIAGEINHALRFTTDTTQRGYITPARHFASRTSDTNYPPMGLRVRLKADYDISTFTGTAKVILTALKKYGLILADNGSDWFISGASDPRWDDDDIGQLKKVPGNAFEAIYSGPIKGGPDASAGNIGSYNQLFSVFPNPVSDIAMIEFTVPVPSNSSITITDLLGRDITSLFNAFVDEGVHTMQFNAKLFPEGIYFLRLETSSGTMAKVMQIIK